MRQVAAHLSTCQKCVASIETLAADRFTNLLRETAAGSPQPPSVRLQAGYELLEPIGHGGMGVVYRARHADLGRIVAFKQIRGEGVAGSPDLARFRAEARAVARLQHPNIVQVYDVGDQDGAPFIVYEYLAGGSLDSVLGGRPIPVRSACRLLAVLARALQAAHDRSVIHRDVKPSNILLTSKPVAGDGWGEFVWDRHQPKIADFGLARRLDETGLTRTGDLLGTPEYMAPEQADGRPEDVGPPTDVYALGVVLYELLTGRRPFQGASLVETLDLVRHSDPVPPSQLGRQLPRALDHVCLKCLRKSAAHRYASAAELADEMQRFLLGRPVLARPYALPTRIALWTRRRPAWASLIAASALAVGALLSFFWWHNRTLQVQIDRVSHNESVALSSYDLGAATVLELLQDAAVSLPDTPEGNALNARMRTKALDYYRGVLDGADESSTSVRLARATLQVYTGNLHEWNGDLDLALAALLDARQRLDLLLAASPGDAKTRAQSALCEYCLGRVHRLRDQLPDAERCFRRALGLWRELEQEGADVQRLEFRLALVQEELGGLYRETARPAEATQALQGSLVQRRDLLRLAPEDPTNRSRLANVAVELAEQSTFLRDFPQAESLLREAESAVSGGADDSPMLGWSLANVHHCWAALELARGQSADALQRAQQAQGVLREELAKNPADLRIRSKACDVSMSLAKLSRLDGQSQAALDAWDEALRLADGERVQVCRAERAVDRASIGDHAAAAEEARIASALPDLDALWVMQLVRALSVSMDAAGRDAQLDGDGKARAMDEYARSAVELLRRHERGIQDDAGLRATLESDPVLERLRTTVEFQDWYSVFVPSD